jgi:hypothetical protein
MHHESPQRRPDVHAAIYPNVFQDTHGIQHAPGVNIKAEASKQAAKQEQII